jgi:hypothetical protein
MQKSEIQLGKPLANTSNETVYTVHLQAPRVDSSSTIGEVTDV